MCCLSIRPMWPKLEATCRLSCSGCLPRLGRGVIVHVHDMFYPCSYPSEWLLQGRAWNESLFLRAFLIGNPRFRMLAFNSYAGHAFPELFQSRFPEFLRTPGRAYGSGRSSDRPRGGACSIFRVFGAFHGFKDGVNLDPYRAFMIELAGKSGDFIRPFFGRSDVPVRTQGRSLARDGRRPRRRGS